MRRAGVVALVCAVACLLAGGASGRAGAHASIYTGYGFDACTAPSLASLQAWTASPYRALGIYIGGVNRACGDGNLSASWVTGAVSAGWSLMPLYVGLQAPCVSQSKLAKLSTAPNTAGQQGLDAADDAIARADVFGLPSGSPIYFDMEGYSTTNASCTKAVQAFVAGWNNELRAHGYVAGVYGSAASTMRDLVSVSTPDDAWIANWNGNPSVFGDKYVPDSVWTNHQRIHQFKGGHKETWGGVTINVDNDYVDAAVVGATAPPPPPPPPPAGSVGSGDSLATASWPAGAFTQPVAVTLTAVTPPPPPATYAVKLLVTQSDGVTPVPSFNAPVDVHLNAQGAGVVPAFSADGTTWTAAAFTANADGSFDVSTKLQGLIGLVPDTTAPAQPQGFTGRFVAGRLVLSWLAAKDNSGHVSSYDVLLDGAPLQTVPGTVRTATVRAFHPTAQTVYRVRAVDAAGNAGKPTRPLVVVPTTKPAKLPRPLPQWAWALFTWQHAHAGQRPAAAPQRPPAWYWTWAAWRSSPFRVKR
ncbi:MAG TPA: glycoside hydrolase domain-containing protein [Burkholderiaceae bacterium]|nr:glycoside hydrolase domain-containing protein [Burkholderiaceae bacterium]